MKTRIISAIVALAIIIPLIIIGKMPFAAGIGVLSILAYKEVIDLKREKELPNVVKALGLISMLLIVFMTLDGYDMAFGVSYKCISLATILMLVPTIFFAKKENYTTKDALFLLGIIIFLGTAFNSFILIRNYHIKYLIYLILITTMTDTFAFLIGSLIGRHKLSPKVSPNKSWEGSIAGSIIGSFIPIMFYINLINADVSKLKLIGITLILSIIGQLGDLVFSKIKRENGIKDFSNIMPGHGGILDRLDSIIFVVLAYTLFFSII